MRRSDEAARKGATESDDDFRLVCIRNAEVEGAAVVSVVVVIAIYRLPLLLLLPRKDKRRQLPSADRPTAAAVAADASLPTPLSAARPLLRWRSEEAPRLPCGHQRQGRREAAVASAAPEAAAGMGQMAAVVVAPRPALLGQLAA
jgi:hypothetical protein